MIESITTWLRSLFHRLFQNELIRRVVKNSSYLFSATGFSAALSMLQGILVARLLGVENFGILAAIMAFTSLINKLVSFRMGEVVIRYVAQYTESGDQPRAQAVFKGAALTEMLASILAFGLICLLAPLAAQYLAKDESTTSWFILYGLIVLANLIAESSMGLLQIFDRFGRVAALSLVQSIGEPRYPSFMGIRKASKATIPVWSLADLGISAPAAVVTRSEIMNPPVRETVCEFITGETPEAIAEALVEKILAEKVL